MRITLLSAAILASGIATAATPVDGWYSSVFGGYAYLPNNLDNTDFGLRLDDSSYKGGYNAGGRIGYQSGPLRYEAEYTYLHANLNQYALNEVRQTNVSGYSYANLLMANIYYDLPEMVPAISPFLGGGIGFANIHGNFSSLGPISANSFNLTDNHFAYQGTVGLTYNFAENYALNLAYRFVATSGRGDFGRIFTAHVASAGAVYRFDQASYK